VRLDRNTIRIVNHYFVTGEEITYSYSSSVGHIPIGIAGTDINGNFTTTLPTTFYAVKVSDIEIRAAATAEDALSIPPKVLNFTTLGVGQHKLIANNQNKKCLIALDNIIQSPVISSGVTDYTADYIGVEDIYFNVDSPEKFKSGDILKIDNEYMRVFQVGIGTTQQNKLQVERSIIGSNKEEHLSISTITKVEGNYNIVDNFLHFVDAPYGNVLEKLGDKSELSGSDLEYDGLDARSKFNGRVFLRSGIPFGDQETYSTNYLFDSLSDNFDGYNDEFTLTENGQNITGFSTNNGIILINDIFQTPSRNIGLNIDNQYSISENSGISSIKFVGTATSVSYDVNTSSLPRGGIIFSIGSTEGYGYQPLVAAAGTAIVSVSGQIQSISIGNSGSGYRSGLQTVNVGVQTESLGTPNIELIGTATIQNGFVTQVSITNPGSGYSQINPPKVVFDYPLSYTDIPLIYSEESSSGIGTESTIDIVVGQNSNVINFNIKNLGYSYEVGEILTVGIGGTVGIPTYGSNNFSEFKIYVTDIHNDEFNGWSVGQFETFDSIENLFDGKRKRFPLSLYGDRISIRARPGSNIDVPSTLILFINNILQKPNDSYTIIGGSLINFTEAPRKGDSCDIVFYRGTPDIDTVFRDIAEPIEPGDTVKLYDKLERLTEKFRTVEEILTSDTVLTNVYGGIGVTDDEDYYRPAVLCHQTEDKFINGNAVPKTRRFYEPLIYPETYIINPVGSSSTEFYVENVKTIFDNSSEYESPEKFQDSVVILSKDITRPGLAAANVDSGQILSISILDSGYGYSEAPSVTILPPNYDSENNIQCTATSTINSNGEITSINIVNPGLGYTSAPLVIIEEPVPLFETLTKIGYEGDFGDIVKISTGLVNGSDQALVFDLFIPEDSYLRNTLVNGNVGIASTGISGISTGYYFAVSNSSVGNSIESLRIDGSSIGISKTCLDNVYQVYSYEKSESSVPGIGVTDVVSVTVRVSNYDSLVGISDTSYYGNYSWGRIYNVRKTKQNEYNSYPTGISTSAVVRRINYLKYEDYVL
jgi:hypothetical protein